MKLLLSRSSLTPREVHRSTRRRGLLALLVIAIGLPLISCALALGERLATTSSDFTYPKKSPSSGPELVRPSESVATSQRWVTLMEPLPRSAALAALRKLCLAIAAESTEDLGNVLESEAWFSVQGERRQALSTWSSRFARLPYQQLPCEQAFDLANVSLTATSDAAALVEGQAVAEGAELVAVVPIARSQSNGEQLFGPKLFVGLRAVGSEYRITGMAEP